MNTILLFRSIQIPYKSRTFEITGDDKAKEYFDIDAETGRIMVKKDLRLDGDNTLEYMVSLMIVNLYLLNILKET